MSPIFIKRYGSGGGKVDYSKAYGFIIDDSIADPKARVTYIGKNENYIPAYMDFTSGTFNFGSWKDAFFMNVKPCMLKYDGSVGYYINPNDYTLKVDGTSSDNKNKNLEGNIMVEFPKIYWEMVDLGNKKCAVYVSDKKLGPGFECWSNINAENKEVDHFYLGAYKGVLVSKVVRSISGLACGNLGGGSETNYAGYKQYSEANDKDGGKRWQFFNFADLQLMRILLTLIGKSTDSQSTFGVGNVQSYVNINSPGFKNTGIMDSKGLFWGDTAGRTGVKVFGIEHLWGDNAILVLGSILKGGTWEYKVKMTRGMYDGSTVDDYNITGDGYIDVGVYDKLYSGNTKSNYIVKEMNFTKYGFVFKEELQETGYDTYYCDTVVVPTTNLQSYTYMQMLAGYNGRGPNSNTTNRGRNGIFNEFYSVAISAGAPNYSTVLLSCRPT